MQIYEERERVLPHQGGGSPSCQRGRDDPTTQSQEGEDEVTSKIDLHLESLPPHMREGVERYVLNGVPPGNFLHAVMSDSLAGAYGKADYINSIHMRDWASWLYNYAPIMGRTGQRCWGSEAIVEEWCRAGGYLGIVAAEEKKDEDVRAYVHGTLDAELASSDDPRALTAQENADRLRERYVVLENTPDWRIVPHVVSWLEHHEEKKDGKDDAQGTSSSTSPTCTRGS